jgi:electron transfer flavoprotein beta subunit
MKIAVVMRQVPDLIEPVEIAASEKTVDLDGATFRANESDELALEQAILIKDKLPGSSVTVIALEFGDVDNTLYAAAAKGTDRIIKIPYDQPQPPAPQQAAGAYAEAIGALQPDLVLVGSYAHDELESTLAPLLAGKLGLPFVGVVRGARPTADGAAATVFKEFPGAALAKMSVKLPALLGILSADEPPRYVPVSRIRAAMKTAKIEEQEFAFPAPATAAKVQRLRHPKVGKRAEILAGPVEDVAARIVGILKEKGVCK